MREAILILFFIFCFLLILGIFYYFVLLDRTVERRINYYLEIDKKFKKMKKESKTADINHSFLKTINESIREGLSSANLEKTEQVLRSAGVNMDPEEYIMLKWFLAAITSGMLFFLTNNLIVTVIGGIAGYVSPRLWLDRKRKLRVDKFNDGLPDMITTTIGSLKSGYSFSQALKTVAEECESPVKEEVEFLLKEMSYGVTMEDGLNNLCSRMPSGDLDIMIQAILIQRQVGGNLAGVLEIIVKTIRERNKIQRQVQALTSQGRLSGRIIGMLPVALGLVISLINPEYINTLFSNKIGIILMSAGAVSGLIGFLLINKLTKIEV